MDTNELLDVASRFKHGLLAKATNGDYSNTEFENDLAILSSENHIEKLLPSIIKTAKTADNFRRSMQAKFEHYSERRKYIDDILEPIFKYLDDLKNGTDVFTGNLYDYELKEDIGNGGYGTVYKYHHNLLDLDFAIKIFEPIFVSNEENLQGENRFFREAKILFKLNHKNIVRIYDIGRINGKPYIRMEYVNGCTIQDFISKYGVVNFERSLKPITALLEGVSYAHSLGVIHRDLKPTNFMVTKDGQFKIIDFGISAFMDIDKYTQLTKTGENIIGGPFSDPVLIKNPKLRDVRNDIYSIGAIWYFLLVGTAPIGGDVREKLINVKDITNLQAEIILQCLSSNIEDRFSSCDDLLSLLKTDSSTTSYTVLSTNQNNKITEITRDAIIQFLLDTYDEEMNAFVYSMPLNQQHPEYVFKYYGRKNEVEFLKKIYDFSKISSEESNFEAEIIRHTIRNDDYQYGWVFYDERLQLQKGDDEIFLKFLCEMFHPLVRIEKSSWEDILEHINSLLKIDGYEIYEYEKISNKVIYNYKFYM